MNWRDLDYPELDDREIMALSDKMASGIRKIIDAARAKYPDRSRIPMSVINYLDDAIRIRDEVDKRILWRAVIRS